MMGIGIPISQSKRPLPILFSSWLAHINVRRELRFHRGDASVPPRAARSHRPMRVPDLVADDRATADAARLPLAACALHLC